MAAHMTYAKSTCVCVCVCVCAGHRMFLFSLLNIKIASISLLNHDILKLSEVTIILVCLKHQLYVINDFILKSTFTMSDSAC